MGGTENEKLSLISKILDTDFMDEKLTAWFGRPVKYTDYEHLGETGKGDSYLSDMFRLKIYGKTEDDEKLCVQVVLKTIPKNIARRKTFRSSEFFANEINFYAHVLPAMLEFQKSKNISEPFNSYTKVFAYAIDGENDIIALEDATIENYGNPVRQDGINLDHCKTVLKTFAKFHAISMAFRDQHPEKFEEICKHLTETYYSNKHWGWYEKFWDRLCGIAIDAVEREYPNSIYETKIKEFANKTAFPKLVDAATNSRKHGVISHGDSWTTNFLFKYDKNSTTPSDAKMIDFQLTRCASPVLDVSFFIYACTMEDLRKDHFEPLLKYYHDHLTKQIREMGTDPDKVYPWDVFMAEVKKYFYFGLGFSFESTPFIVLDPEDAFLMEQGTEASNINDFWPVQPYKKKAGVRRAAGNVKHAVDNGYI